MGIKKISILVGLIILFLATREPNISYGFLYPFKPAVFNLPLFLSNFSVPVFERIKLHLASKPDEAKNKLITDSEEFWQIDPNMRQFYPGSKKGDGGLIVTPEPIGAALFILGACSLAIIKHRRKDIKG